MWVLPLVIFAILGVFVGLWAWTVYLETAKASAIRKALHVIVFISVLVELHMWNSDCFKDYVAVFWCFIKFDFGWPFRFKKGVVRSTGDLSYENGLVAATWRLVLKPTGLWRCRARESAERYQKAAFLLPN